MDAEKLVKIGDPIMIFRDRDNNSVVSYYLVGITAYPVGIATYQYKNDLCTAAFLKDAAGRETLIEHNDDGQFAGVSDVRELYRIYRWAFE